MAAVKLEPKLTPANKKLITDDWAAGFPELSVYKPMWLLRRLGPLVVGICLDRTTGNDCYRPTFHVHCLARASDSVSLTLCQRMLSLRNGTEESIRVRFHYDHVEDAIKRMATQATIPLSGPVCLSDVIRAYDNYVNGRYGKCAATSTHTYEDLLAYYVWCGRTDLIHTALGQIHQLARDWDPIYTERVGGADAWIVRCENLARDPEAVRRTVDDEVIKFKLTKVPDAGLDCA